MSSTHLLVEERHTGLKTPGGSRLVGSQAVSQVQVLDAADSLLVEGLPVGGSVEVKVTSKDLVATLAAQDHLDTHGLDLARKQVHGGRGSDGGDIVGLEVVDDVGKSVETILNGKGHDVVLGTEELGDLKGSLVIGRTGQTDGEGVELGKVGEGVDVVVIVDTDEALASVGVLGRENVAVGLESLFSQSCHLTLGNSGSQTGVETTRQKNTKGNLGHETLSDSLLERMSEDLVVHGGIGHLGGVPPRGVEVASGLAGLGVIDVAGRESDNLVANGVQALQLGGEVNSAGLLGGPTLVEGGDADRVAGSNGAILLLVVEHEREHAIEVVGSIGVELGVLIGAL